MSSSLVPGGGPLSFGVLFTWLGSVVIEMDAGQLQTLVQLEMGSFQNIALTVRVHHLGLQFAIKFVGSGFASSF